MIAGWAVRSRIGGEHRLLQVRGHLRLQNQPLDGLADLGQGLRVLGVQLHLALIDFIHQVVVGQEIVVGPGGDGEARRDGQPHPVQHFAQAGVLAAHRVHHLPGHPGQGQDQFRDREFLALPQALFDAGIDPVQHPIEHGIFVAGEDIQALDHAEGVKRGPGRLGAHVGHAEDLAALQLFFQVGHEVQQLAVGIQQVLEAGIAEAEGRGDLVPGGLPPVGLEFAIEVFEEIEGLYHDSSQ